MSESGRKYSAFVSYRHHAADRSQAIALMRALETFATPASLRKQGYPSKLNPLFRDDDEAGVHDTLSAQLQEALANSEFLLVICTPRTKDSAWVRREVEFFRTLGRGDRIIPVVAEGDPAESIPAYLLSSDPNQSGWESDQALAIDLRPQQHEKPAITFRRGILRIAAAILECRYDDLAQRAATEQRRRRIRAWAAGAAALVILLVGLGFSWDAFLRTKYSYFANYSDRWGVPVGVGRLTADTWRHRGLSFRIATRGGQVVAMAHVNGHGTQQTGVSSDQLDEPWQEEVAEWRYLYRSDGLLSVAIAVNQGGQEVRRLAYDFGPDRRTAVVRIDAGVGRSESFIGNSASRFLVADAAYERVAGFLSVQRSNIGQHRLTFDETGLAVRRLFEPLGGGPPVVDANGVAGRSYAYDNDGLTNEIRNLGLDGLPDNTPGKAVIIVVSYLRSGDVASNEYRDASGLLIADPNGVARATFERDRYGNVLEESSFDANGAPAPYGDWGAARVELSYDQHGDRVEIRYFGADGAPTYAADERAAIIRNTYDRRGLSVEESYFDDEGAPILARNTGAAALRWRYDAHLRIIEETALGVDHRPTKTTEGQATARYAYDAQGNQIEISLFDEHGRPTPDTTDGCAVQRAEYDDQRRVIRTRCLGVDGQPALDNSGAYGENLSYDARGNLSEFTGVDIEGRPVAQRGGTAVTSRFTYDDAGRLIEFSSLASDGSPAITESGSSIVRIQYDVHGRILSKAFFGQAGQPVLHRADRIHAMRWRYNAQGNVEALLRIGLNGELLAEERGRYDARGRPVEASAWSATGAPQVSAAFDYAHRLQTTYDARGNVTEIAHFDITGVPHLGENGEAVVRMQYSQRDDLIEISLFGANGALIRSNLQRYDARGNRIEETVVGLDGQLIIGPNGWAIERIQYDTLDRPIELRHFGVDGRPTITSEGDAGIRKAYDARGYIAEEISLGLDNEPMAQVDTGIAIRRFRNDARGNVIEERRFGVNGVLRESDEDGYAVERLTYDSGGALIESTAFDAREQPLEGLSTIRYRRDAFGHVTEVAYFGPTRQPVTNYEGVAVKRLRYDETGMCVTVSTYGLSGAAINERPVRLQSECPS